MKWLYDRLEYFCIIFLFGALFFFILTHYSPSLATKTYAETLFDTSRVHRIDLILAASDFNQILENPTEKIKYHADITIDGETIHDVSVATRGNATLFSAAALDDFSAYSYKINFEKWNEATNYRGLDALYLNNFFSDPSYLKDFLAFELMRSAGVATPLVAYTEVYINDSLQGLYLAVEGYDKSFLARTGSESTAALLKPEPLAHDNFRLNALSSNSPDEASLIVRDIYDEGYDTGGADLKYRDDNPASYPAIFENSLTKLTSRDQAQVISALKSLETGDAREYWDFDALARYLAVHNFIVSDDSYIGLIPHNFVLRLSQDRLSFLPWDYDIAYRVNWDIEAYPTFENLVNISLDSPPIGLPEESRPLWAVLKHDQAFQSQYFSIARDLLSREVLSGALSEKITATRGLIYNYVLEDPSRRSDMSEFESSVDYLDEFLSLRASFLIDDLNSSELLTSLDLRASPAEF